jgi:hypothetical protein
LLSVCQSPFLQVSLHRHKSWLKLLYFHHVATFLHPHLRLRHHRHRLQNLHHLFFLRVVIFLRHHLRHHLLSFLYRKFHHHLFFLRVVIFHYLLQ